MEILGFKVACPGVRAPGLGCLDLYREHLGIRKDAVLF